jgi:hypothetical protein
MVKGLSIQIGNCELFPSVIVEPPVHPWPPEQALPTRQAIVFCPFLTCGAHTTCFPPGISIAGFYQYRGDPASDKVLQALLEQLVEETEKAKLPEPPQGMANAEAIVLAEDDAGEQKLVDKVKKLGGRQSPP